MTLLELLIAIAITTMVVGTLGALSRGAQEGFRYTEAHGLAIQHARVALDRIGQTAREATTNEQFPGMIVVAETVDSWRFPDTLVIWHPEGTAADPDGLPRYNELVIYCPDVDEPNRLVEITVPDDTRTVPPVEETAQWAAEIAAIKASESSEVNNLTSLIRTGLVDDNSADSLRGAVRFEIRLRPSQDDWDDYMAGVLAWEDLSWVQGIYGSQAGMRQVWLRSELQLVPSGKTGTGNAANDAAIAFPGSAALYYELSNSQPAAVVPESIIPELELDASGLEMIEFEHLPIPSIPQKPASPFF